MPQGVGAGGGITFGSVGAAGAASPQQTRHIPHVSPHQHGGLPPELAGASRIVGGPAGPRSPQQTHAHSPSISSAAVGGPTAASVSPQAPHRSPLVGSSSAAGAPQPSSIFSSPTTLAGLSDLSSVAAALPPLTGPSDVGLDPAADLHQHQQQLVSGAGGPGSPLLSQQRSPSLRGSRAPGSGRLPPGATMGIGVGVRVPAQPAGTMGIGVGVGVPSSSALRGVGGRGMRPYRGARGKFVCSGLSLFVSMYEILRLANHGRITVLGCSIT